MVDVAGIFHASGVRGLVPEQLDESVARAAGVAFVEVLDVLVGPGAVLIGHDLRPSGPALAAAFAEGVASTGADVVDLGPIATDQLYFASGRLDLPGAMFTADHDAVQFNGILMCRAGAVPVGTDSGLRDIADQVAKALTEPPATGTTPGHITRKDLLTAYADHLHELVDLSGIRPLTVVVDAGNGVGGRTVPAVLAGTPVTVVPLHFELDDAVPNHEADPQAPKNLGALQAEVRETGADLGLAFDGDADPCVVVDEKGDPIPPSAIIGAIAVRELAEHPGAAVVHDLLTSKAVPELITEHGGTPVRSRAGHLSVQQKLAATDAVFGGEHSGHYYFRGFWRAGTGLAAALHVLAALGAQSRSASELFAEYARYVASGEISARVDSAGAVAETVAAIEDTYSGVDGVTIDHLDGLTVSAGQWWFNVRATTTEPLLRLNVEAVDGPELERVRDEVLALITGAAVKEN